MKRLMMIILVCLSAHAQTTLTCWGDSLTYGYTLPRGDDYPGQLATMTGWTVNNMGANGQSSVMLQDSWTVPSFVGPYTGDYTVIWIGHNDLESEDPSVLVANIDYIIARLTSTPKRYLILGLVLSSLGCPSSSACIARKAKNAAMAAAYPGHYLDMGAILLTHGSGSPEDNADIAVENTPVSLRLPGDASHLNALGEYYVARAVMDWINSSSVGTRTTIRAPFRLTAR